VNDALTGIRVLDLGQYLAGPLASLLLAQQGAEVVRIEPPGGPRWHTRLNRLLLADRSDTVTLDLTVESDRSHAVDLAADADVLVENFRPGVLARLGLAPQRLLERHSGLVVCSLPGFGTGDPRATLPGWEGVVLAAAGCYATGSREMLQGEWWPTNGPAFTPLLLASVFGAALGAVGVTAALLAREEDGQGQHVEVPLHDAFYEAMGARLLRYERNAPGGALLGSGFYRCADGRYVSLITVWHRHLEWFLRATGNTDWLAGGPASYQRLMADVDGSDGARTELSRRLVELFATRPALAWERLGHEAGVPLAAVRTSREWLAAAPTVAPDSVLDDRPAPPVRLRDGSASRDTRRPATGGPGAGPLAGTTVLDLTRVLAAPTVARILADLGADVLRVDVASGVNRAGLREPFFHESVNRGKRLVTVDLKQPGGMEKLVELCGHADALVTNFTPPAMKRLGLDEPGLRASAPHLVHAYVNAFGANGAWADLRGYAEIANAVTGVTARTLGDGPPSGVAPNVDLPRAPTTDYAAGVLGAYGVLLGLLRRRRIGRSAGVTTTLVDAACLEQLAQVYGDEDPSDPTGRLGWSPLQRLYEVADGWVFLGVAELRRTELLTALGVDPAFVTGEAVAHSLAAALAGMTAEEAGALVATVGGAAQVVVSMDSLLDAGGPADLLGLRLAQQSPVFGEVVQPGPVIRFSRTPMRGGLLPEPVGL
jgi:crotonobetainyl-CoA:carnitine CoA-transferase CaiB-like acyl-CoA transferase